MNERQIFINECRKRNINPKDIFKITYGTKIPQNDFFSRLKEVPINEKFVIKCIYGNNLYIAWNAQKNNGKKYTVFYANKEVVMNSLYDKNFSVADKNMEFSGHGKENIYIFNRDGIPQFLNEIVICREEDK